MIILIVSLNSALCSEETAKVATPHLQQIYYILRVKWDKSKKQTNKQASGTLLRELFIWMSFLECSRKIKFMKLYFLEQL